jgi:hypothetical protein
MRGSWIGRAPELLPVVEVVGDGEARLLGASQCFGGHVRGGRAQGGGDAAHVEVFRAFEDLPPVELAHLDRADGRTGTVIEYARRTGRRSELDEIDARPAVVAPHNVGTVDAELLGPGADHPAEGVLGELRDPGALEAEPGDAHRYVELRAAHVHIEAPGLFKPLMVGGGEPDHGLSKGDDIVHEGSSFPE